MDDQRDVQRSHACALPPRPEKLVWHGIAHGRSRPPDCLVVCCWSGLSAAHTFECAACDCALTLRLRDAMQSNAHDQIARSFQVHVVLRGIS
eukprot:6174020-Pleurochrysis_carterae.AAC.3